MSRTTIASERRIRQRKRPHSLIYVELGSSNGGMMKDLSEKGFAMRVMMPLRADESTTFAFSLNASIRVEGTCRVLWVEEGGRVAGLQFTEVAPELRGQVRSWLEEQQSQASKPAATSNSASPASTMQQLRDEIRSTPARPEIPEIEAAAVPESKPEAPALQQLPEIPSTPAPAPVSTLQRLREELRSAPARQEIRQTPAPPPAFPTPEPVMPLPVEAPPPPPAPVAPVVVVESPPAQVVAAPPEPPAPVSTPILESLPALPDERVSFESFAPPRVRERSLVSLGLQMMLLFAVVAVGVVFRQDVGNGMVWLGTKIAGPTTPEISPIVHNESPPLSPAPSSAAPSSATEAPNSAPSGSESTPNSSSLEPKDESGARGKSNEESAAKSDSSVTLPATNPTPVPPGSVQPATRPATFPPASGVSGIESGQSEFLAAEDILKRNSTAELPEAVKLLWSAVEKGNANAEVALAELYRQGKGVAKNCDQTNILLSAAARKGNAMAQKLLREFQLESCE
jgi:hypothetical protein